MARSKVKNTNHAYYRAAERCGWNRKKAREMMTKAQRFGLAFNNMKDGPEKEFVKSRQLQTNRRIKYYNGYLFVFCSTSTRCLTVYPVELS